MSSISSEVGTLFIQRAKRYAKFELEITSQLEPQDVENYGFVLLVELAIANPISPVLSKTSKKILSRFPSWTKLFEDSLDAATPEIQTPSTTGGSFINALVNDFPDNFEKQVNLFELDRFVTTSDVNQLAWIYVTSDVPASMISITGDNVPLARVETLSDLYSSLDTDYVYYYNAIDREIITLRLFKYVTIDTVIKDQVPALKWNWFDEFGAKVGLKRLYLETNSNFKNRILDVYVNRPGSTKEQIKKTLRRELDIWSAYGATPDSNYLGATPELIEISDIESSSPYFDNAGKPQKEFRKFVRDINEKYPVNWGYVKWDNGFWDYAGKDQSGVGRVPAIYDDATPLGKYYQPGIGDFDDANIIVKEPFENEINFNARFKAYGTYITGYEDYYSPVNVDFEYYGSYYKDYYDNAAATANFTYEVYVPSKSAYYYADIISNPRNSYPPDHPASPEYELVSIFDQDGYTYPDYQFRKVSDDTIYVDDTATPSTNKLNIFDTSEVSITPTNEGPIGSYNIKLFNVDGFISDYNDSISMSSPYYLPGIYNVQVSSNLYNKKRAVFETDRIKASSSVNASNISSETKHAEIDKQFIHNTIVFEEGATPIYVHIENVKPIGYSDYKNEVYFDTEYDGYGGLSISPIDGEEYLIPSSPNLSIRYVNANFATPEDHFGYYDTDGATVDYYFVSAKYPYGSTPDQILLVTNENEKSIYPYQVEAWDTFEQLSTPMISGAINKNGIVRSSLDDGDKTFSENTDLVGRYILGYDTFGIDPETYFLQKIEVDNSTDGVEFTADQEFVTIFDQDQPYTAAVIEDGDYNLSEISVRARYTGVYNSFINTGWYNQLEDNYYIYSGDITETHTTPGFELTLNSVARQGAPIIIECDGATPFSLREVAFFNEATPTMPSLRNVEVVYANRGDSLFVGYEDVYDAEVVDLITGYTVESGLSSLSNELQVFSESTPSVYGRGYEVSYYVSKSFMVDNDHYDSSSDSYKTKIYFESTPNFNYSYDVVYESLINGTSTPISLEVDPMKLWDQEGFVYLSHLDYDFDSAKLNINPSYVLDDGNDYMIISINSLDVNGNNKPYQTFELSSDVLYFSSQFITTDINGFNFVRAYYSGPTPLESTFDSITVSGVTNGSAEAHINSQTEGFEQVINFEIVSNYRSSYEIKATVDKNALNADGLSKNYIYGVAKNSSTPSSNSVVYWRKGRSLHDVFEATPYSSYVTTDEDGKFTIGPFTAEDRYNPGIWLVSVETEHSSTPTSTPNTISGDIVYWVEKYDNLNYTVTDTVLFDPNVLYTNRIDMMSTPNFPVNYYNGIVESASPIISPDWIPPKWYPIDRYSQYQMGLLGSTPYYVNGYENLMKDYEEE